MPMIKDESVIKRKVTQTSEFFCKQGCVFSFLCIPTTSLPMCLPSQTLMHPSAQYFAHKDCKLIDGQVHDGWSSGI